MQSTQRYVIFAFLAFGVLLWATIAKLGVSAGGRAPGRPFTGETAAWHADGWLSVARLNPYRELSAVVNGWERPSAHAEEFGWVVAALEARAAG